MTDDSATGHERPDAVAAIAARPEATGVRRGDQRRVRQLVWRPADGERVAVVARARNWLGRSLPRLVELGSCVRLQEDTELLLSELVTNAVLHAGGVTTIRLRLAGEILRVTVCDHVTAVPALRNTEPDDEHGRGLALVTALATRWGVERRHPVTGKCVWLELSTAPL
ncbi:ATP-binding protein [Dactylosporangium sp. NPDC049742]|uniref:ATP-binding protein n=1 Tax=Dactylosporangium sp. NPDC049742 TaxID=3154737 RepID=UPI003418B435